MLAELPSLCPGTIDQEKLATRLPEAEHANLGCDGFFVTVKGLGFWDLLNNGLGFRG